MKRINKCFPWCFDVYRTKVNYRIDPNKDEKQKSFESLLESNYYNIEDVQKIINKDQIIFNTKSVILDYKLKQDYDDKYLYTPLDKLTKVGDIFYWPRTNTHWIVYAQYLTEKSYYKCLIKKADWCLSWKDEYDVIHYQWAYVRGPVETKTKDIVMKNKIYDIPNATLTILIPSNIKTKIFKKYYEVMLNGKKWQVAADVDDISNPGLTELQLIKVAVDYNDDKENNVVDGKDNNIYEFKQLFNDNLYAGINYDINDLVRLYKNGELIQDNFIIESNNRTTIVDGNNIMFLYETEYEVIVKYSKNLDVQINLHIDAINYDTEEETDTNIYSIIGPTTIRSLLTYTYYYNNEINDNFNWQIINDNNHVIKTWHSYDNYIDIVTTSKTGNFVLQLYDNDNLIDELNIQVIGTFE